MAADSERDFTINAIYLDIDGKVTPQLGTYDLNNRNVKVIGDPNTRIEEDYLRIIRLLRFAINMIAVMIKQLMPLNSIY